MKILPVIYSQNTKNTQNTTTQVKRRFFETSQDTFTKTQSAYSPSFGNGSSFMKIAQDVINSPDLRQKYAKFTAEAFLALLGIAGGRELIKNTESKNGDGVYEFLEEIPTGIATGKEELSDSEKDTELEKLRTENARLTEENEALKKQNALLTSGKTVIAEEVQSDNSTENVSAENNSSPKASKHRCKHVKFPKKNGRLSDGQKKLKLIAEKLRLNNDECAKLTAICKKSLEKNTYVVNNRKADNSILAALLAEELEQNKKEPEAVIDKYYKLFGLDDSENQVKKENGNIGTTEMTAGETAEASAEEKTDVNILGSDSVESEREDNIQQNSDIVGDKASNHQTPNTVSNDEKTEPESQIDAARRKRVNLPAPTPVSDHLGTCHVVMNEYDDPTSLHADGQYVVPIDAKAGVYSYYDPAAYEQDEYTIFKNMQRRFEAAVFKNKKDFQKVFWISSKGTAYKVRDNDVENEIRGLIGASACEYLTIEDTAEVADAINADDRFGKYFKLHAAIRLIDRFANFDDLDVPIEDQCHEILDSFVNIVKRAFHNRINIKLYVDEKTGDFGERIFISPSQYNEQDKKYFKDKPLVLGLGRISTFSPSDRQPVIVTVFNDNGK